MATVATVATVVVAAAFGARLRVRVGRLRGSLPGLLRAIPGPVLALEPASGVRAPLPGEDGAPAW